MRRSPGRRAAPARRTAPWKSDRSGKCRIMSEDAAAARDAAENVARRSYGKLVAYLSGRARDVAAAEDALADAFAAALAEWPRGGIPQSPEAWLLAVARRKTSDAVRRQRTGEQAADHLTMMHDELEAAAANASDIPDQRL